MVKFFFNLIDSESAKSTKRFVGILGSICIFTAMLIWRTEPLIYSACTIVVSALGLTGVENIAKIKNGG